MTDQVRATIDRCQPRSRVGEAVWGCTALMLFTAGYGSGRGFNPVMVAAVTLVSFIMLRVSLHFERERMT